MGRSIYYGQNHIDRILGLSSYAEGVRLGPHVSGIDELLDGAEIEHIEHPTFVPSDVFELMLGAFVAKPGRTTLFNIREFYEVARWRCSSVCGSSREPQRRALARGLDAIGVARGRAHLRARLPSDEIRYRSGLDPTSDISESRCVDVYHLAGGHVVHADGCHPQKAGSQDRSHFLCLRIVLQNSRLSFEEGNGVFEAPSDKGSLFAERLDLFSIDPDLFLVARDV